MNLPKLFKEDAKGKTRIWYVRVKNNIITIKSGLEDGKLVKSIKYGEEKNVGKKNYMDENEHAISVAKSIWRKKVDSGYEPEDGIENHSELYEEKKKLTIKNGYPIRPMLAQKYLNKTKKSKTYEDVYVQPKLDGFRCVASFVDGKVILNSRGRTEYTFLKHIKREMKKIFNEIVGDKVDDIYHIHFDGELYCHNMVRQELSSRVKRKNEKHEDEKSIEYHIYDMINTKNKDMKYKKRYKELRIHIRDYKYIKLLKTIKFDEINEKLAATYMENFIKEGYEGLIIRKSDGVYKQNYRSPSLMKYKQFDERDAIIKDVIEGKDGSEGCAIFKLKDEKKQKYKYYARGTMEEKKYWFENRDKLIGTKISLYHYGQTEDEKPECIFDFRFREKWDIDE